MVEDTMFSGESKNIEYKVSLPDKSEKYMKTIVAFANTQGGKLIVGVDDKTHQIVGVENDVLFQLMDGIANAVSDSCVPQIIPDIEPQTVDGKTVIVVSCCSSHYLRLYVAHYLQPFSRLSRMPHHIIQVQLCKLNTVTKNQSTLFNPNEFADSKNIRVFCNI